MTFLDCPAYLDDDGAERCGLPAEVQARVTTRSSDGPVESVKIRCPAGHWFNAPIEFLTCHPQLASGHLHQRGGSLAAGRGSHRHAGGGAGAGDGRQLAAAPGRAGRGGPLP